jgi:hypothetical protein
MIYLVAGLAVLFVFLALLRGFTTADPAKLGKIVTWFLAGVAVAGAAVALALLLLSERLIPALVMAGSLAPIGFRLWAAWRRHAPARGPAAGRNSKVETEWLSMRLDHASGAMSGTVKRGPHAGRRLDELGLAEIVALWRQCRVEDEDAARLLEAYLDRLDPDWRRANSAGGEAPRAASSDAMTLDEALAILGLAAGANEAQIRDAHRGLMMKLHPDHGGSTYLAAKLNRAKEVLLGG